MKIKLLFLTLLFSVVGWGQYSITGTGAANTYTQNFDNFRGTALTLPSSWAVNTAVYNDTHPILTSGAATPTTATANSNNCYAGRGSSSSSDYSILQKQGTSGSATTFTLSATNNTGNIIDGFVITWNVEQFASLGRATTLDFKYRVNGGTYVTTGITGTTLFTATTGTSTTFSVVQTARSITITGLSIANASTIDFQFSVTNGISAGSNAYIGIDDFTVYATAPTSSNTITTNTSLTGSPFCSGTSVSVPFTSVGTFTSGNTYTAQLSNAAGSFASAVNIGTLSSTANSGTISATIPVGTVSGSGYKIRVVSSAPSVTGTDNTVGLTVNTVVAITTQPIAQSVTAPATATFTAAATGTGVTYQWQVFNGSAWSNVSTGTGGTTVSYTTAATTIGMNGYQYRVVVSGTTPCVPVTSTAVTLTVAGVVTPVITSALTASGTSGTAFAYTIVATNTPTSYSATGLPTGVVINTTTGALSGTPTVSGTFNVTITATNGAGTDTETLVITLASGPCLSETFESGATPSGWSEYSVIYGGQNCEGTFGLVFDANGDYVITSAISNPASMTFMKKRSSSTTAWALTIQVSTSNSGPWTDAAIITLISAICELETIDLSAYTSGTYYIRIIDSRATGTGQRTIDDLKVYCGTACTPPATPIGTISGTTPACGSTTLSYSAPNANLYWQTTAGGTATTNPTTATLPVTSSGTYYVKAYDGVSCWSTGTASYVVVINTIPTVPTTANPAAVCEGTAVTVTGAGSTGSTLYTFWDAATGGTKYVTGGVYTVSSSALISSTGLAAATYTYYVQGETATCVSSTRKAVTVTINTTPSVPAGAITVSANPSCGPATLSYPAGYYWQTTATGTVTTSPTSSDLILSASGTRFVRAYNGVCWSAAISSGAITINAPIAITVQPLDKVVVAGATTTFSVTATGTGRTYQWQVDTGSGFTDLANGAPYTNVTTTAMTITGATLGMTGYLYRCVVSGTTPCTSVTSSPGVLTVNNEAPNNPTALSACYGNTTTTLSWTAPAAGVAPDGYMVFVLAGATAPAGTANNAATYTANTDFSLAATVAPATLGKCVYKGTGLTTVITGLTNGVVYSYKVVAYKGATQTGWSSGVTAATGSWIIANVVADMPEVSAFAASIASTQAALTWTRPTPLICYDEYLVVANQGAVVFTPSGDGTAYTANTVYSGANQVVYKGTGTGVTVTALTDGISYCYKVFVRRGTAWSTGVEVCQVPNLVYCTSNGENTSWDTSVTNVTLNTINNTSLIKTAGYMDYTAIATSLERNGDYPLSVSINTDGNYTVSSFVWIDFNHDGDFNDAGEAFGLGSTTNSVNGATTFSPLTITVPLTAALGATTMRVIATYDGDSSPCLTGFDGEVEDYTVFITPACTPTHSVTSYTPTSGPTATEVTITGTGFTAGTTVTFNGISATVVFVSTTTLTVTVPGGLTTGDFVVKEAGCKLIAGTFTKIEVTGSCITSNNLTDLIISEVYDSLVDNSWYMELYNPTSAAIDLDAAGGNYKLVRYGDIGTTAGIRTVDISGIIPPGGIYLADLGTESSCGVFLGFDFIQKANGINENDEIRLTKEGVTVDIVHCPNEKGYSLIRIATAAGPSATYNAADWTSNLTESCANLDVIPFVYSNTTPTVNTNPIDVSVCGTTATFDMTATANSGALTYQWFYNDGTATGWTALTTLAGVVITGETTQDLTITGTISTYNGYQFYCQVTEGAACSKASNTAQLYTKTTWNGTAWSHGVPTISKLAVIDGNYNTTTNGNIDACSIIVNTGFTATITSGGYFNIQNDVTVSTGGTLDILNNGSLVQISDTGVNTGTIIMHRTTNVRLLDYVYWSSPVAGFSVNTVSASTPSGYRWKWNPTIANGNGGEGNWQSASGVMGLGTGYIVRAPNGYSTTVATPFTANFTGVPNNGILTPAISRGTDLGAGTNGPNGILRAVTDDNWNLLGNPYPSAISIGSFLTANTNLDGFVRLWTHGTLPTSAITDPFYDNFVSNYTADDYVAINGLGATSGPGTLSVIGAGQGFFVLMEAGTAATSSVTFNNAMRNKTFSNSQFFRNANSDRDPVAASSHRIWLDLVTPTAQTIRTLVGYVSGATNGRDRLYDAITDYKSAQNFYSLIGTDVMTIQGRALPFIDSDQVPMGLKVPANGTYKIAIAAADGMFENGGQVIYLEDKLLGIIHNLSASFYEFTATQGIANERFVLRYTDASLGNEDFEVSGNSVIVAAGNQQIKVKSASEPIKNITVYDVLGRLIFERKNISNTEFAIHNLAVSQQTLLVKIVLENGKTFVKKIIL